MPTANLTCSPTTGGAVSTWNAWYAGNGKYSYSTPTTDGFKCTVTVPASMKGATFNSVAFTYTGSGASGTKAVRYNSTSLSVTNANLLEKLQNGDTTIELYFSFRATGGTGYEGTHSASYTWSNVAISVDYTPASVVNGTITLGTSSSVFYAIDKRSLAYGETLPITLSITPDKAVTAVRIELDDSSHTAFESASMSLTAASNATTTVTLNYSLTSSTVLASRVNAGYIRITLTTADGNEVSAWTATDLKLITTRNNPSLTAAWSDTSSYYTTFGGYLQTMSHMVCAITPTLDTTADPDVTIASRRLAIAGATYTAGSNAFDIGSVDASGSVAYTITIVDSYGKTGTLSGTLSFIAYVPPYLSQLAFERYNPTTLQLDDSSDYIWVTAVGAVSSLNSSNAWTMVAAYSGGGISNSRTIASDTDGGAISYTQNRTIFPTRLSDAIEWAVTVTLTDQVTSASYTLTIPKSGGIFNIEKKGVAVGQRSTGTTLNPIFESAYPAHFYAGIYDANGNRVDGGSDSGWQSLTLTNCSQASGWAVCACRKINGIVYVRGAVTLSASMISSGSTSLTLTTLPDGFRPAANFLANSGARANYSSIEIDSDGSVKLWNRIGAAIGTTEVVSITATFPLS